MPQYYVEDSYPAIIAPEQFALVQDIFAERSRNPKHSGATIFSGRIRCGCCGGWYGSKVWHSNDKYRRVIWQCNHKFKDKTRCSTPHLTEDQVKDAFVRMANKLYADREFYITELTAIKDRLADTTVLEKERRILDEQLGIDVKAVNDLIARNARVAQNQKEYNERYDALVSRYEDTERKRDAIVEQIDQIMIRRRKIERFIDSVKDLPGVLTSCASIRFPYTFGKLSRSAARPSPIKTGFDGNPGTEFDESLWAALVDSMTVYSKDRIVFRLTCGMEIEV